MQINIRREYIKLDSLMTILGCSALLLMGKWPPD